MHITFTFGEDHAAPSIFHIFKVLDHNACRVYIPRANAPVNQQGRLYSSYRSLPCWIERGIKMNISYRFVSNDRIMQIISLLFIVVGLCVPKVGKNAFEIAKNYVDKTVIVRYLTNISQCHY